MLNSDADKSPNTHLLSPAVGGLMRERRDAFFKIKSLDFFLFRGLPSVPSLYLVKGRRSELGDGHRIHGRDLLQLISLQPFATGWGSILIELSARTAKPGDATVKHSAQAPRFCCKPRRNHLLAFGEGVINSA